jgi:hypothetical protein
MSTENNLASHVSFSRASGNALACETAFAFGRRKWRSDRNWLDPLKIKELNVEERIKLITNIQNFLEKQYHINHTTLQMVSAKEAEKLKLNCNHCN